MDKAIEWLTTEHEWMTYAEAMALVVDAYERFADQSKYHGPKNVDTLVGISVGIYARDEDRAKNKLAELAEWI
tara:strand:+ start:595 stop:813 length:219 start_codon:yes stop_codon:yes gene_type:complete